QQAGRQQRIAAARFGDGLEQRRRRRKGSTFGQQLVEAKRIQPLEVDLGADGLDAVASQCPIDAFVNDRRAVGEQEHQGRRLLRSLVGERGQDVGEQVQRRLVGPL